MSNQGTAQKTNPIVLLWKMLTQPSNEVVEDQGEKEETILTDIEQSSITEEQKKEFEKSLGRVKILQDKLQIMNFERTTKAKDSKWKTNSHTQQEREEQKIVEQELIVEQEENEI